MNDVSNRPDSASIIARVKAILTSPSTEWAKIATETDAPMQVFMRYSLILAAIGPIATFVGGQVFGYGALGISYKPSLINGLSTAIVTYLLSLAGIWIVAWVANFLSPKFGGKDDFATAFRLVAYAMTANMVVGIFGIIPMLGILGILGLYSLYLFYLGAKPLMEVPEDKAIGYTIVTVIIGIIAYVIIGAIAAAVAGTGAMASGALTGISASDDVSVDMGDLGSMQTSEDGATMTIRGPDGEEITINVNENEE